MTTVLVTTAPIGHVLRQFAKYDGRVWDIGRHKIRSKRVLRKRTVTMSDWEDQ